MRYLVVIEKGPTSYGAYCPDIPGCVAVGDTVEEVKELMRQAIEMHLQLLADDGDPIPLPVTQAIAPEDDTATEWVDVPQVA